MRSKHSLRIFLIAIAFCIACSNAYPTDEVTNDGSNTRNPSLDELLLSVDSQGHENTSGRKVRQFSGFPGGGFGGFPGGGFGGFPGGGFGGFPGGGFGGFPGFGGRGFGGFPGGGFGGRRGYYG